jgi:hypothetical protein
MIQMNINVNVRLESPELMAAILALAEALPQMRLGSFLPIKDEASLERKGIEADSHRKSEEIAFGESSKNEIVKEAIEEGVKVNTEANIQEKPPKGEVTQTENMKSEVAQVKTEGVKTAEGVQAQCQKDQPKAISLEYLRSKLAALSAAGKQKEVKALINKFGGNKLTEILEDKYAELLKEAEEI